MKVMPMDFIGHLLPIQLSVLTSVLFVCQVKIQLAHMCVFHMVYDGILALY